MSRNRGQQPQINKDEIVRNYQEVFKCFDPTGFGMLSLIAPTLAFQKELPFVGLNLLHILWGLFINLETLCEVFAPENQPFSPHTLMCVYQSLFQISELIKQADLKLPARFLGRSPIPKSVTQFKENAYKWLEAHAIKAKKINLPMLEDLLCRLGIAIIGRQTLISAYQPSRDTLICSCNDCKFTIELDKLHLCNINKAIHVLYYYGNHLKSTFIVEELLLHILPNPYNKYSSSRGNFFSEPKYIFDRIEFIPNV